MRINHINNNYFYQNRNLLKVYPIHKIDKQTTTIKREHQEIKKEFERIFEQEQKKRK
ncbi:MAG: hypothetical protein GX247_03895 [Mollicutes bacterium]|jgi:hypothetical protein|nr:hypothetical protein [Mollicutes bacterium]